ncbi:MAG: phosphomannose isomerase type II C-terminal cupin domain [Candidatus Omnitrophota bacterium]
MEQTVRPWGEYRKLFEESGVWVKRVEVKPQNRLSLQKHHKRSEKWIFVSGHGKAEIDGKEFLVGPSSVIDIALKAVHRITNTSVVPLVFIEVACGSYLGEDDIVRLEDDYNRKK